MTRARQRGQRPPIDAAALALEQRRAETRRGWGLCWPDWPGPAVGGHCEPHGAIVVNQITGRNEYLQMVPLKIVEIAADSGSLVGEIDYDEKAPEFCRERNGTRVALDMAEVWPPVSRLIEERRRLNPPPPTVYPTPRPFHLIPTDFAERMARARDADEGRDIIHEHELALWEAQVYAGWHTRDHANEDWLVGPTPWGYRGFSVQDKRQLRKLAAASPLCGVLVAAGQQMEPHWQKLLTGHE